MLTLPTGLRVFLAVEPTDMRKSFDTLAAVIREKLALDPLSGQLFVFRSRRGDRVKLLYWDDDGLLPAGVSRRLNGMISDAVLASVAPTHTPFTKSAGEPF